MITYKMFKKDHVYEVRDLCNALMRFQAEHATILPEMMESMNFKNRLLKEFQSTENKVLFIAYDEELPVGFAFATVTDRKTDEKKPSWAEKLNGQGFYPEGYQAKRIGTFKLLYVNPNYRGLAVGKELSKRIMEWLCSQVTDGLWVYVANGNEGVGKLYEKLGFKYSHSVYNGFIEAYSYR